MSVHFRADSKHKPWQVRWRDAAGKGGSRSFRTKKEAERFDAEVKRRRESGDLLDFSRLRSPFTDLLAAWLTSHVEPNLAPKTARYYAGLCERYVIPGLGGYTLGELTAQPHLVQQFADDMAHRGVGADTRRKVLVIVGGMFRLGVRWRWVATNPVADGVDKPRVRRQRAVSPFSVEQVEGMRAFLLHRDAPADRSWSRYRDAALLTMGAYTGGRPGELLGAAWRHVRPNTILFERAASNGQLRPTKTGVIRAVPLDPNLADDLAVWREHSPNAGPDDLIFPAPNGQPWSDNFRTQWTRRYFRKAAEHVGLPAARLYDLRHTYVSLLISEGIPPHEVAMRAGHSPVLALTTYSHLVRDYDHAKRVPMAEAIKAARQHLSVPAVFPPSPEALPDDLLDAIRDGVGTPVAEEG